MKNIRAKVRGYFLIVTGLLVCPCHLPITLPILLALTAGTALGALLANNVWLIVAVSVAYFVGALALGWRYVGQGDKVCALPDANDPSRTASRAAANASGQEV